MTVNDLINADSTLCALFFVKPPVCAALAKCVEPAVWCWHSSCPYQNPSFEPCIINDTSIYYCSCSSVPPDFVVASTTDKEGKDSLTTRQIVAMATDGLPAGALASIIILSLLIVAALLILCIWLFTKYKRRRKLEGRYCPATEEEKSAVKNLPPLPPPAIEGLI